MRMTRGYPNEQQFLDVWNAAIHGDEEARESLGWYSQFPEGEMHEAASGATFPKVLIKRYGPIRVYRVEGEEVRNSSPEAEEFNESATYVLLPDVVPEEEVWIEDTVPAEEQPFVIYGCLAQIATGDYDEGERLERAQRAKAQLAGTDRTEQDPPDPRIVVGVAGVVDGKTIDLVDAEIVRDQYKVDFALGGNPGVYPWIPENHIWLDSRTHPSEQPVILYHEMEEEPRIARNRQHGWVTPHQAYLEAHNRAKQLEWEAREKGLPADFAQKIKGLDFTARSNQTTQEQGIKDHGGQDGQSEGAGRAHAGHPSAGDQHGDDGIQSLLESRGLLARPEDGRAGGDVPEGGRGRTRARATGDGSGDLPGRVADREPATDSANERGLAAAIRRGLAGGGNGRGSVRRVGEGGDGSGRHDNLGDVAADSAGDGGSRGLAPRPTGADRRDGRGSVLPDVGGEGSGLKDVKPDFGNQVVPGPIRIRLPLVRQENGWFCGPASLVSCLAGLVGRVYSQQQVAEVCKTTEADGTDARDLAAGAEQLGLHAAVEENLSVEDLQRYADHGMAPIIEYQAYSETGQYDREDRADGHFSVIVGYNDNDLVLMDPSCDGIYATLAKEDLPARWFDREGDGRDTERLAVVVWNRADSAIPVASRKEFAPDQPRNEHGEWTSEGGSSGSDWTPENSPQWERRRDREEGTQAEADREVRKADAAVNKAREALLDLQAKVEVEANQAGYQAVVKDFNEKLAAIESRKAHHTEQLKASQDRIAELKAKLAAMKTPKRKRDAGEEDLESIGALLDAELDRLESLVAEAKQIADDALQLAKAIVKEGKKSFDEAKVERDEHGRFAGSGGSTESSDGEAREPAADAEHTAKLDAALKSVIEHTGYTQEQIHEAFASDASPKNAAAAKIRARVAGSILLGGTAVENAVLHVPVASSAKGLIAKITTGDKERAQKELGTVPLCDVQVLGAVNWKTEKAGSVCNMASRTLTVGKDCPTGDARHEMGHAVRSALGGESYKGRTQMTKAIAAEYDKAMQKAKANPACVKVKLDHEFYEKTYGVAGKRGLDSWEENFAEHFRLYQREIFRDKHEGGGGRRLAQYRERHPGMTKILDSYYTAALVGAHAGKA